MITDRELQELGLPSFDKGYYSINEDVTVDAEGHIRIEHDYKNIWIAQVVNIEELKVFIECINR